MSPFPPFKKPERIRECPLLRATSLVGELTAPELVHLTQSHSSPFPQFLLCQPFRFCASSSSSSSRKSSQIAAAYSYSFTLECQRHPLLVSPVTNPTRIPGPLDCRTVKYSHSKLRPIAKIPSRMSGPM